MRLRLGVDCVDVEAFRHRLQSSPGLAEAWFSAAERRRAEREADPAAHLAGWFAAKEAFAKALGDGLSGRARLADVTVAHDAAGAPALRLRGEARRAARQAGARRLSLSITHAGPVAVAVVAWLSRPRRRVPGRIAAHVDS